MKFLHFSASCSFGIPFILYLFDNTEVNEAKFYEFLFWVGYLQCVIIRISVVVILWF